MCDSVTFAGWKSLNCFTSNAWRPMTSENSTQQTCTGTPSMTRSVRNAPSGASCSVIYIGQIKLLKYRFNVFRSAFIRRSDISFRLEKGEFATKSEKPAFRQTKNIVGCLSVSHSRAVFRFIVHQHRNVISFIHLATSVKVLPTSQLSVKVERCLQWSAQTLRPKCREQASVLRHHS